MSKKISQETFDEVVRENVEDFDINDADALRDAIEQFIKQGVGLTNIDISGGIGRTEMLEAINQLKIVAASKNSEEQIVILSAIGSLCSVEHDLYIRNQMLLCEKGGVNSLHLMFNADENVSVLLSVIKLLNELSRNNEEIRDFFEPGGCIKLCTVLVKAIQTTNTDLISAALGLARTVNKSENNKFMLMRAGVGEILVEYLNSHSNITDSGNTASNDEQSHIQQVNQTVQDACKLVRALCVHDDIRKDMSCAYENGKFFIKQTDFVRTLSLLAAQFKSEPGIASAALHAMRNLITTEESVQVVAQHGVIDLITGILGHEGSSLSLVRSAAGLMRNVCADDIRKDKLVIDGTLNLLVCAMAKEVYACDPSFMEHALATLAAMSLRSPNNSELIVKNGMSMDIIVRTMRRHADKGALQRQGCLTIRNIAARCPDLRTHVLDAGVEPVLRAAGRLSGVVDEAYAALRDLGVDVMFVKIGDDGRVMPAYETFGGAVAAGGKLQFNPVYDDDSSYIEQRVQEEARPPLQPDRLRTTYSDDEDDMPQKHQQQHVFTGTGGACCGGAHEGSDASSSHSHDHDHSHAC